MPWDLADLATTACRDTFGETVTYTPQNGQSQTFKAIFNEQFQSVSQDGIEVASTQPVLDVRLADLDLTEGPQQGDSLTVDGRSWSVVHVEPDGQGSAKLFLHQVS